MIRQQNSGLLVWSLKLVMPIIGKQGWITLLLWLVFIVPVQAAVELRVAIAKGASAVTLGSSTNAVVKDGAGKVLGEITAMEAISAQTKGSIVALDKWQASQLWIEPKADGYVWVKDRWYRGRTRIILQGNRITAVNYIDLEEYLYSVVGAEAIASWPDEALKAQAVAARTYAIYKSTTSSNQFYDLDTTTQTQVYKGLDSEYNTTHDAVNATRGQILTYNGKAILAVFHSSSGGHTENVEDVWASALPYLRGVVDYDQLSPGFQWTKTFTASELGRLIGGVGKVRSLLPERITPNGRIMTMKVVGDKGTKKVTDDRLRKALNLRSTLLTVSKKEDVFAIVGRGFGHGIGLSQWGTYYLAGQGILYDQILAHYYQNARITQMKGK